MATAKEEVDLVDTALADKQLKKAVDVKGEVIVDLLPLSTYILRLCSDWGQAVPKYIAVEARSIPISVWWISDEPGINGRNQVSQHSPQRLPPALCSLLLCRPNSI